MATLVSLWWLIALGAQPVHAARPADAKVKFVGTVNAAGQLSSIAAQPSAVAIEPGDKVAFVNQTAEPLTVTVAGQVLQLDGGDKRRVLFNGGAQQETYTALAVDPAGAGAGSSSSAEITVAAGGQPAPAPDAPTRGAAAGGDTADGDTAGGTADGGPAVRGGRSAATAGRPSLPPSASASASAVAGGQPSARADPIAVGSERDRAASQWASPGAGPDLMLPPLPGLRTGRSQLGLLILLSAALAVGIGAALVRAVLAYRPMLVGAHSVDATRARRAREPLREARRRP